MGTFCSLNERYPPYKIKWGFPRKIIFSFGFYLIFGEFNGVVV